MLNRSKILGVSVLTVAGLVPGLAFAADGASKPAADQTLAQRSDREDETTTKDRVPDPDPNKRYKLGTGAAPNTLPPPRSSNDPQPPVASPTVPSGGVVKQAGVGGDVAYGRTGVLELGGSAIFSRATDFTQVALNPSIGWFFMDDLEVSLILGLSHISTKGSEATFFTALVEPSLHLPFSDTVFGMIGAGVGPSYVSGPGVGLAFAPRIGVQFLLGRSGILTPSAQLIYSTHDAIITPQGTLLAVNTTYGLGIGYTVMW